MLDTTVERILSISRASSLTKRSTYLCLTRASGSFNPLCLSGRGRSDFAVSTQLLARTVSSPRLVVTTSPVIPTKSPKSICSFHLSNSASPTESAASMICRSIPDSRIVEKINFPVIRFSITRPAIATFLPVLDSG